MKIIEPEIPLPLLFALESMDRSGQLQGLSQLSRHEHLLAHHFAAVGSGCQHASQFDGSVQGGFRGKGF